MSSQAAASAGGIAELDAERQRERAAYGEGALIVCDRVVRIYAGDGIEVQALQGLDLLVAEGELTAIIGASGSGKSTLMNILAGLDRPTAGTVRVDGHDLGALTSRERLAYRRGVVGFIWQQTSRNLLPYLTGRQNVLLPMRLAGVGRRDRARRADELLDALGVADCAQRGPGADVRRRAAADRHRHRAGQPAAAAARRRADRRAGHRQRPRRLRRAADGQRRARRHGPGRDARSGGIRAGAAHGRDPRRPDQLGNPAPRPGRRAGHAAPVAVEYAVLDRAGRVQLPSEMTGRLGMRDRVRLQEQPDHIQVWPDRPAPPPAGPPPAAAAED